MTPHQFKNGCICIGFFVVAVVLLSMTFGCGPTYRKVETHIVEEWGNPAPNVVIVIPVTPDKPGAWKPADMER